MDEIGKNEFNSKYNILTRKLIRSLSQDARISITELCKVNGGYRRLVGKKVSDAEKALGIKYTIEFNEPKIGLNAPHMVLVKLNLDADYEEIAAVLKESYVPQMAALMDGQYELLIYANAPSSAEYVHWDKTTQVKLAKYISLWEPSDLAHRQMGFFPIRNETLEKVKLPEEYKPLILKLNQDARISFSRLAKELGMYPNTLAYRFKEMMNDGYIKRFTMVMDKLPGTYPIGFFGKYAIKENFELDAARSRQVFFTDDQFPICSRYVFVSQLVGTYDFFSIAIFDNEKSAYKDGMMNYRRVMKRHLVKTQYAHIKKVILGDIPIRSLDTKQEYNVIRWV